LSDSADKGDAGVANSAATNGRLATREAAEMLKKKKAKRDSNQGLRIIPFN
jgi:hypothetical protein